MTTPERLAETVREALDWSLDVHDYGGTENPQAHVKEALAALDSLLAAYEEMRRKRDTVGSLAAAEAVGRSKAEIALEEMRRERDEAKQVGRGLKTVGDLMLERLEAAEREVEEMRRERDRLREQRDSLHDSALAHVQRAEAAQREVERLRGNTTSIKDWEGEGGA